MDWARRAFIRLHITQNLESACSLSKLSLSNQTKGRLKLIFRRPSHTMCNTSE
ncbi:MAG: hypothetical protein E6899_02800 [Neisseria sp.]|uniref:hypothetical protein n=1 Tax=Neisseria sp. HMSC074B07 TaxID=1715205 RepID=UPI0014397522|nr:hypothetical protein [Neisseria sp. HMSC074B07]MDU1533792.1 hypothetical protein [Neisseria sp.]